MSVHYSRLETARLECRAVLAALALLAALGYASAHYMDAHGHHVTGMNNRVVWGIPHVFALGLILAASGALNIASLSSVFGRAAYRPLARLSALLAVALLLGGLAVLALDLGRPERLLIAMTHYNFQSVFAWNIVLYTGFIALALAYLWALFEPHARRHARPLGALSLAWRFILSGGSGAIFAVLARPAWGSALLVPLFIFMSLSFGGAAFTLVALGVSRWHGNFLDAAMRARLAKLLALFIAAVLLMTLLFHLSQLRAPARRAAEVFLIFEGGLYPGLFWSAHLLGGALPLALLCAWRARMLAAAAALVALGGFAHLYALIIGGQVIPPNIFPDKITTGGFYDSVATYSPSAHEWLLGGGGIALALLVLLLTLRVLPFLPAAAPPRY